MAKNTLFFIETLIPRSYEVLGALVIAVIMMTISTISHETENSNHLSY